MNAYRDSVLEAIGRLPAGTHAWADALRRDALEAAHRLALPGRSDEDWRFTDLSALYKLAFRPAVANNGAGATAGLEIAEAAQRIVFVDGMLARGESRLSAEAGLSITPLPEALGDEAVRNHLARLAPIASDAFVAINTAWLRDGVVVRAHAAQAAPAPLHLLFVSTQSGVAVHPRVLVIAETGAELTLIEEYASAHAGRYAVNAVTEMALAPNAGVHHVRLQREAHAAFHIATCAVRLARDARYSINSIAAGAAISRLNLHLHQEGPGASIRADGLALIGADQLADTHSFIEHAAADGSSRQSHKTVLAANAHAVFNGRILVRPGAQRTDSAQESRNLLLSGRAHVDTKPQLEIFADDVKCAHGATVGQLEAEELFYLRSRGLDDVAARNLLTYAFAAEIVDRIGVPSLVERLRALVLDRTAA